MKRSDALWLILVLSLLLPARLWALASPNVPLGSPVYGYIDKLAALGLISSDFAGIKPLTRSEAARLLHEAQKRRDLLPASAFTDDLLAELATYLKRELDLYDNAVHPVPVPTVSVVPIADMKARYVYLDGTPRSYDRPVNDPGGEGVFGIGSGLRPDNPYPTIAWQRGTEGTPLLENNEGVRYAAGNSVDLRFTSELHLGRQFSLLVEPMFLSTPGIVQGRVNKGYLKLGSGGLELEVGRDSNWLGFGKRGALTLSNNASNFDLLKISSPEPLDAGMFGKFKYALIVAQMDRVMTLHGARQPWFYAIKASLKPSPNFEIGINLGRQQGGPGVSNSVRDNLQGLVGGTTKDNSNSLGGVELRWRMPSLRNSEIFVEYSGEDAAKFWPFVESYLAGLYIPRLTVDGKNDLRFEYFLGNNILYTHSQFTEGYLYQGMPIGHSQGGATQDIYLQYRHWFSAAASCGLEYFNTKRGITGRLPGQAREEKHALRGELSLPLATGLDLTLTYGWEHIRNFDLVNNDDRINNLFVAETTYRF